MSLKTPYERVSRRSLLAGAAATTVVTAAASLSAAGPAHAADATAEPDPADLRRRDRPNVVLVVLDDLGWGELGCYGQQQIATPHIDALAARGLRFEQAYATPTCAPTRAALLQGLHTGHARVRSNADATAGLSADDVTVAEVLQGAGYRTALIGKWGLGPDSGDSASHPNRQGFDEFFGYINQRHAHDYWPTYLWRNHERVTFAENEGADVTYAPELFTTEALAFVERAARERQPFFLALTYNTPHAPNEVPSDAPYGDRDWPQGERNHAAQITWTDAQIGTVVQRLEDLGLLDETLVLVTSDNGPHKEGANYGHVGSTLPHKAEFFDSNADLRGAKRDLYEGGIRVPLVARLPRTLWRGPRSDGGWVRDPVALWDLFPTLAELAREEIPAGLDGVSLVPLLTGRALAERPYLYWEFHEGGYDQAVRWGRWKVIRHNAGARTELFDLDTDRGEKTDLASLHPEIVGIGLRLIEQSVTPRATA